jgi:hypothetical protein
MEAEWCRISHHVHLIEFRQIVRDAEIAYAISLVVRRHRLSAEKTEKFLLELRIPRAANVAGITDRLVVFQKSQLADKLLTEGELRTRDPELIGRIAPLANHGDVAPITREVLRQAEHNPASRPRIHAL